MRLITPSQCRAARGLLNWSQPELARRCGIHKQTISNFEAERSTPKQQSLEKIAQIFEKGGIEFGDNESIARKHQSVCVHKGQSGFINFITDVYETIKEGGEVFVSNVNENYFLKWEGDEAQAHMERMASVPNLKCFFLIEQGDTNTVASHYAEYRQVSREHFDDLPLYMYGNKTALIVFEKNDVEIFIINHAAITLYFRSRFLDVWKRAKKVESLQ